MGKDLTGKSEALLYRNFIGELGKTRIAGRQYED
jgi:hypothetical protein